MSFYRNRVVPMLFPSNLMRVWQYVGRSYRGGGGGGGGVKGNKIKIQ